MPLFRRKSRLDPPDPWCVFIVGCSAEEPPPLDARVDEAGAAVHAAGATRGLRAWWPENFPEE